MTENRRLELSPEVEALQARVRQTLAAFEAAASPEERQRLRQRRLEMSAEARQRLERGLADICRVLGLPR